MFCFHSTILILEHFLGGGGRGNFRGGGRGQFGQGL